MLSASAAFANSDDATLSEVSGEISVEDNTLLCADDSSTIKSNDDSKAYADNSYSIVTNDTFFNYFDKDGILLDNVTSDELIFNGEFGDLDGISYVTISKPITLTGNGNAVFNGIGFEVDSNDVTIDGFSVFQKNTPYGILIGADNVVISNNYLEFTANANLDSHGIYSLAPNNLQIIDNTIIYEGNTNGTVVNNAVRIEGDDEEETPASSIVVSGNDFELKLSSVDVKYDYDTYAANYMSEGIVFYYCEDLEFVDNRVNLKYGDVTTAYGYDTLYAVSVRSDAYSLGDVQSSDVLIANNTIDIEGYDCAYAVYVCADEFEVYGNNITSISENYLAHGIDIDGPSSSGSVSYNKIEAVAPRAYGIYSYQYLGAIEDIEYSNNLISVDGYLAGGMEIVECNPSIVSNTIYANGNYTYGIVTSIRDSGLITGNEIVATGSNTGDDPTGDGLMPRNSMAISINGEAVISNNIIGSSNIGINIGGKGGVVINKNTIGVETSGLIDSYGIYAKGVDDITIVNNDILFASDADGTVISNGVRIEGDDEEETPATNILVSGNTFDLYIPSVDVIYDPVTFEAVTMSEGILFYYCEDLEFVDNIIDLEYYTFTTAYGDDSVYAVSVRSDAYTFYYDEKGNLVYPIVSKDVLIANNTIEVEGHDYAYGVTVAAEDFEVSGNNVTVTSEINMGHGIDIAPPSGNGLVDDNRIIVEAPAAYGIYSDGAWIGPVYIVTYSNNKIEVDGYLADAFELMETNPSVINNTIYATGNYTYGVVLTIYDEGEVSGNEIIVSGTNVGDKPTGDALTPKNSMGISVKGNSTIAKNIILSTDIGINLVEDGQITVDNNNIQVISNTEDIDNHAVVANNIDYLDFTNNYVQYVGASTPKDGYKTAKAYAMYVVDSEVNVENNTFDITVPSLPSDFEKVGDKYIRHSYTEGLVFDTCDFSKVVNNEITLDYDGGDSGSIYAIDVLGSNNFIINDNEIVGTGESYMYAIIVEGDDFVISNNSISAESDYYVSAIDVEESDGGIIDSNIIDLISPAIAYPIYGGVVGEPSVEITNNSIAAQSYFIVGVEFSGGETTVNNNTIDLEGNYTIGIAVNVDELIANNNTIRSQASNVGNVSISDSFGTDTTGIKSKKGKVTVIDNNITTTGIYTVDIADADGTVHDNYLISKELFGDISVYSTGAATVYDNLPIFIVVLNASDLEKVYGDGQLFVVTAYDEAGDPVNNMTLYAYVEDLILNATTDEMGVAEFNIELPSGKYIVTTKYDGIMFYVEDIENNLTVIPCDTEFIADNLTVSIAEVIDGTYFNLTLSDGNNGLDNKTVTIKFNNQTDNFNTDKNGVVSYKLPLVSPGNYTIEMLFDGDSFYGASNRTVSVEIYKTGSFVSAEDVNVTYGDDITVVVTSVNATYVFYQIFNQFDEEEVNGTVEAGENIEGLVLDAGEYTVNLTTINDVNHYSVNNVSKIIINRAPSFVSAEDVNVTYGEEIIIEVTSSGAIAVNYQIIDSEGIIVVNGTVEESVLSVLRASNSLNGIISGLKLGAGDYKVNLTTVPEDNYAAANYVSTLTVNCANSSVNGEDIEVNVGDLIIIPVSSENATSVSYEIIDKDGSVVAEGTIEPGEDISVSDLPAGDYTVNLTANTDGNHSSSTSSSTLVVNKIPSSVVPTANNIYVSEDEIIDIYVGADDAEGIVNVTVGDKIFNDISVVKGSAQVIVSNLSAGKYMVNVTYSGDDKYLPSNQNTSFEVNKVVPSINVSDLIDGKLIISLPDDATGNVMIEVNGKTYTQPVIDGKAVFDLSDLNPGSYEVKIYYSGDEKYSPVNTTDTIKVLNNENNTEKDKIEHLKTGLSIYETANPIMALFVVLIALGFSQLRRFKK